MPKPKTMIQSLFVVSLMLLKSTNLQAHEFWIEPEQFQLQTGDKLTAHIKVGQNMIGDNLYYLPNQFQSFAIHYGKQTSPIKSRLGDLPAVSQTIDQPGLHILAYVSTNSELIHKEPEKFMQFLEYEGIEWVNAAHQKRGLPKSGFSEAFQRFAKSLIQVGNAHAQDKPLGLPFELILLNNPYTQKKQAIQVQLLWEGQPLPNAQINVFKRDDQQTTRQTFRTNQQGRASISHQNAKGVYLLNAVHMIEPPAEMTGIAWKSLWASTTFAIN